MDMTDQLVRRSRCASQWPPCCVWPSYSFCFLFFYWYNNNTERGEGFQVGRDGQAERWHARSSAWLLAVALRRHYPTNMANVELEIKEALPRLSVSLFLSSLPRTVQYVDPLENGQSSERVSSIGINLIGLGFSLRNAHSVRLSRISPSIRPVVGTVKFSTSWLSVGRNKARVWLVTR